MANVKYTGNCWWDHHPFEGESMGCPIRLRGQGFDEEGFFCSARCALAYGAAYPVESLRRQIRDLRGVWLRRRGLPLDTLNAPHFSLLAAYGGTMDIGRFRGLTKSITSTPAALIFRTHSYIHVTDRHRQPALTLPSTTPLPKRRKKTVEECINKMFKKNCIK